MLSSILCMKITIEKDRNISDYVHWPEWGCDISTFDWEYRQEEHCFIIEGEVTVVGSENTVKIVPGDYVIFPKGLRCVWEVHKPIRKHYTFK